MPTMGEAARMLGIGRVTLEKWCKRLEITPARHPYDYRFYVLTDEQVGAIREARQQMPGAPVMQESRYDGKIAASTGGGSVLSRLERSTPPARRHVAVGDDVDALPDGLMSAGDFAAAHGLKSTTVSGAMGDGRLPFVEGSWRVGVRGTVKRAILPEGHAAACRYWETVNPHPGFRRCPNCPVEVVDGL